MNTVAIEGAVAAQSVTVNKALALRTVLLSGCVAVAAVAAVGGEPSLLLLADPSLAFLLRGMAIIKGAILLCAVALLFWRFGQPVSQPAAAAYALGTWLAVGATVLIWQLTVIPTAAVAFHVGELTVLVTAFREGYARFPKRAA